LSFGSSSGDEEAVAGIVCGVGEPFVSSDAGSWMRPYYVQIAQRPEFARLSVNHQFGLLLETIAKDHPAQAAKLHGSNATTQRAILDSLADVTCQQPAAPAVELWRVRKGDRELQCVAVYLSTGVDLRLLECDNFRRTELIRDASALDTRAAAWKRMLNDAGWV
jgi:hypothetical protein